MAQPAFHRLVAAFSLGGILSAGALLGLQQPARAFLPVVSVTNAAGAFTTSGVDSSFGFFFRVSNPIKADGLGFLAETGWQGGGGSSYTVALWECQGICDEPSDYNTTPLAQATFDPAFEFYTLQQNYWWQSIAPVTLDPSQSYVVGAYGDYSDKPGNVQYAAGTPSFNPNIVVDNVNGFNAFNENDPNTDVASLYPIPAYFGEAGIASSSYFNPNVSLVPGPLPALGALGAYGWARKLRRRVKGSL